MFNNLSFSINTDVTQPILDDLIDPIVGVQIASFIASNGSRCSTISSLVELIKQNHFVSERIANILIVQVLGIRNICANWMNLNATVDFVNMINNTVAPIDIDELKTSAYFTCEHYFSGYDQIYTVVTVEDIRDKIYAIVDDVITWSKSDGSGTWEYYVNNITTNYDYEQINNQLYF